MKRITVFYVTFPDEAAARSLAGILLEQKLIACANIIPATGLFFWQGAMQDEKEWIGLFKTKPDLISKVREKISASHPYEVPCIISSNVNANDAYVDWVFEQTMVFEK
ncbi:MAG TPA: divalent-cation tolerance protein CutA [Saprospiraceae bacterium]|nr:divalent-cation tolerance protein CutA [Saprospirales bacterium]HRQ30748.1 divalent-cation tolerance protein CutA [Saprospiraceae bacterium]